jgi:hypothetical protein
VNEFERWYIHAMPKPSKPSRAVLEQLQEAAEQLSEAIKSMSYAKSALGSQPRPPTSEERDVMDYLKDAEGEVRGIVLTLRDRLPWS